MKDNSKDPSYIKYEDLLKIFAEEHKEELEKVEEINLTEKYAEAAAEQIAKYQDYQIYNSYYDSEREIKKLLNRIEMLEHKIQELTRKPKYIMLRIGGGVKTK